MAHVIFYEYQCVAAGPRPRRPSGSPLCAGERRASAARSAARRGAALEQSGGAGGEVPSRLPAHPATLKAAGRAAATPGGTSAAVAATGAPTAVAPTGRGIHAAVKQDQVGVETQRCGALPILPLEPRRRIAAITGRFEPRRERPGDAERDDT